MKIKCPNCRKSAEVTFLTERASKKKHAEVFYTYECPACDIAYTATNAKQLEELLND